MAIIRQEHVRKAFDGAAETYDAAALLQAEVCHRLLEKLEIVRLEPQLILDAGSGTGLAIPGLQKRFPKSHVIALDISEKMLIKAGRRGSFFCKPSVLCGDLEALPLVAESIDLVFSSLSMQWCNNPELVFEEVKRVLKPGGLFVFTTFGPDTLKELRYSWEQVDSKTHVNHFIDMHDIGDGLLHGGYAEPVMEAEIITVNYTGAEYLLQDLRHIGANVTAEGHRQGLTTRRELDRVYRAYEKFRTQQGLPATYEIIYGHAWKSSEANQKSSNRGSTCNVSFSLK